MEPLYPARTERLEDLARQVVTASAEAEGRLAPATLAGVRKLLRIVNSYYSNLIEGHNTHPVDIERAMRHDYSTNEHKRDLQTESEIHIEVQDEIATRLQEKPDLNVASPSVLKWIHERFYSRMPEHLCWVTGENQDSEKVQGGILRARYVQIGRHVPPTAQALDRFLERFAAFYDPAKQHGVRPLVALAAAHHRLMWIHPFLDGNGRVARLFTDAYFIRSKISGYGLWNVSRGLARRRESYRANLASADLPREGDLDGRSNLSERRLTEFCEFFLEVSLDQAQYMNDLLALTGLLDRLATYVNLRVQGLVPNPPRKNILRLRPEIVAVLHRVAISGEISRGEISRLMGVSERLGRDLLNSLLEEGLLLSESSRGPVRLGFPAHAAGYLFPGLYPLEKALH
ncbi:MAG TPA: Fic family protein [Pyrinomonadaceae bacterium]